MMPGGFGFWLGVVGVVALRGCCDLLGLTYGFVGLLICCGVHFSCLFR